MKRIGFTLIELMVVLAIISLLAGIAIPTLAKLFGAGAAEEAHNILSAQLSAARALAVGKGTYAGVHIQLADDTNSWNSEAPIGKSKPSMIVPR